MKLKDSLVGDIVLLELSGKIMGGREVTYFYGKMHEYFTLGKKKFLLDMDKVEWTNSEGIGMLLGGLSAVSERKGRMILANITNIETVLAITKLCRIFETYDSRSEAFRSLSEPVH